MAIAVIISLIGTASLYLYSASQDSLKVDISDIDREHLGSLIETQGFIRDSYTYEGSLYLTLVEEGSDESLETTIDEKVVEGIKEKDEIIPGAKVWVRGTVESYEGSLSLRVTGTGEFKIMEKAYTSFKPISSILENPEWFSGMRIKVRGCVNDIERTSEGTNFELSSLNDTYHRLKCKLDSSTGNISLARGDPIAVKGEFNYDEYDGRWTLNIEEYCG